MIQREVTEEKQILLFSLLIQACNIYVTCYKQIITPQQYKKGKKIRQFVEHIKSTIRK
jgi:hypothetical protein